MTLHEEHIHYFDGDLRLQGFLCYDPRRTAPMPAVLLSPTVAGRDELMERKARRLAWQGYVAFALDMYGDGRLAVTPEDKAALMGPLKKDRASLLRRIMAAYHTVKALPMVDARRIGAMGYCFGGTCVLDLARSGADVRGVVSLHGLFAPNGLPPAGPIRAKVLILHGFDDPLAPPQDMLAVMNEMTQAGVDWQLHAYGGTSHAFTNPKASSPDGGLRYNPDADRRAWHSLTAFLEEVLR